MTGRVVFVDLDSTLADTTHRHHLIDKENRDATDWAAYSMACGDDTPVWAVVTLLKTLSFDHTIVILSARDSKAKRLTRRWLRKHGVPYDDLLMKDRIRHHRDWGPNAQYKLRRMREWLALNPLSVPVLMIDDYPTVKELFEANGIPTLLVQPPGVPEYREYAMAQPENAEDAGALV